MKSQTSGISDAGLLWCYLYEYAWTDKHLEIE